jgi:hypothetical protein
VSDSLAQGKCESVFKIVVIILAAILRGTFVQAEWFGFDDAIPDIEQAILSKELEQTPPAMRNDFIYSANQSNYRLDSDRVIRPFRTELLALEITDGGTLCLPRFNTNDLVCSDGNDLVAPSYTICERLEKPQYGDWANLISVFSNVTRLFVWEVRALFGVNEYRCERRGP